MKRWVFVIGIFLALISASSCGTENRTASAKAISIGEQVLETVDGYLDGTISYDRSKEKINSLLTDMNYLDDQTTENDHCIADKSIRTSISSISTSLTYDNFKNDSDSYDRLLEHRNNLAEKIGEKKHN